MINNYLQENEERSLKECPVGQILNFRSPKVWDKHYMENGCCLAADSALASLRGALRTAFQ